MWVMRVISSLIGCPLPTLLTVLLMFVRTTRIRTKCADLTRTKPTQMFYVEATFVRRKQPTALADAKRTVGPRRSAPDLQHKVPLLN